MPPDEHRDDARKVARRQEHLTCEDDRKLGCRDTGRKDPVWVRTHISAPRAVCPNELARSSAVIPSVGCSEHQGHAKRMVGVDRSAAFDVVPSVLMVSGIEVRLAEGSDWPVIWQIMQVVTRAGDTFTYPTDIDEKGARSLWMESGGQTIVAVDTAGCVLGTAKMSANHMGPGGHVATGSFMVAPFARRLGVGRCLGNAVIDWAKAQGFRAIQFNAVVSTNFVAIRLWQSLGFSIVGTIPGAFAHPTKGDVSLHVMHRSL